MDAKHAFADVGSMTILKAWANTCLSAMVSARSETPDVAGYFTYSKNYLTLLRRRPSQMEFAGNVVRLSYAARPV
jgi:hypothetical protein